MISFFCKKCKLDQDRNPLRINEHAYAAKCQKCRGQLLRYINDKHLDPYYRESLKLQRQRSEMANDLVQYGDPRFKNLYRDQWDKFEQQKEDYELKKKRDKEAFDKQQKSFLQRHERKLFGQFEEKLI